MSVSTACPKCGSVARSAAEVCPSCGIVFRKYAAHLERLRQRIAPPGATDLPPDIGSDASVWSLIAANVVSLVVAIVGGWQVAELMLVYWLQSVIIGASYYARILGLDKFSTENFTINDRPVPPTRETKVNTASFFLLHYGFFHVAYLIFIVAEAPGAVADAGLWLCGIVFAINHAYSYRYHKDLDRRGTPNIGTLMFTPYLRILPMHLTIVIGALATSTASLLLFGALKTVADVGMHYVEHRTLRRALLPA